MQETRETRALTIAATTQLQRLVGRHLVHRDLLRDHSPPRIGDRADVRGVGLVKKGHVVDLNGVGIKIKRAKRHLQDLHDETRKIERACRNAISYEYDEQTREHITRFDKVPQIDPMFTAIAGDVIHNLRSALDHFAWQLVLACGGTPKKGPGGTTFPILPKRRPGVDAASWPDIAPGVDDEIRQSLDIVQPYQRQDPTLHDLMVLHQLDITDKHQTLIVQVIGIYGVGWFEADLLDFNSGPYADGDEICRFLVAEGQKDFEPSLSFAVRFDEPTARGMAAIGAAKFLELHPLAYVEQSVIPLLLPLL